MKGTGNAAIGGCGCRRDGSRQSGVHLEIAEVADGHDAAGGRGTAREGVDFLGADDFQPGAELVEDMLAVLMAEAALSPMRRKFLRATA